MFEVRRPDDDELCGFVANEGDRWSALTVFGGVLGTHADRERAERQILNDGLAAMAERWTLVDHESGQVAELVMCADLSGSAIKIAGGDALPPHRFGGVGGGMRS